MPTINTLVQQEQKDWGPQTSMIILDALDAIQWAWILIQIGTENEVTTYIDRFKTLTRRNAHTQHQSPMGHLCMGDRSQREDISHF